MVRFERSALHSDEAIYKPAVSRGAGRIALWCLGSFIPTPRRCRHTALTASPTGRTIAGIVRGGGRRPRRLALPEGRAARTDAWPRRTLPTRRRRGTVRMRGNPHRAGSHPPRGQRPRPCGAGGREGETHLPRRRAERRRRAETQNSRKVRLRRSAARRQPDEIRRGKPGAERATAGAHRAAGRGRAPSRGNPRCGRADRRRGRSSHPSAGMRGSCPARDGR